MPRRPRASFVVTLSATAATAALVACGGSVSDNPATGGDADTTDTAHPATECPKAPPASGDACSGTLSCDYSACGTGAVGHFFQCIGGRFVDRGGASCNPPPPECPRERPRIGSACVGSSFGACSYTDACTDRPADVGGSDSFTCGGGTWRLSTTYVANCPASVPTDGSACTCGDHLHGHCTYGDCYGLPSDYADCDATTGLWRVSHPLCNPPPPAFDAGSSEAGSGSAEAGGT